MSILIRNMRRFVCIVLLGCIGLAAAASADRSDDVTSFFRAVQMDDATTVKRMIAARALGPNAIDPRSGEPALIVALREGSNRVIDALLAEPAIDLEVNAPNTNTALMMAAFKHNKPAVVAMLAKGAVVNRPGWTALHYAAASGDDEIARILLRHGARIDAEAPAKFTPLMIAAREGQESTVRLLLEEGADATRKNSESLTAAQIALRADKPRIAADIEAHLAKR
jgi:ankyrin repeat protein